MDAITALSGAVELLLQPRGLSFLLLGVLTGLFIGLMPGVGGVTGLAILLPFAVHGDPTAGLGMMIGVLAATSSADTFAAVLFAIPGSSSSQATILDGHPMAQKGEAGRALSAALLASLLGGIMGAFLLTGVIFAARPVILGFQSPELFMLGLLGLSMIAVLTGGAALKGLVAGSLGLMIGMIGFDGITGSVRWAFGSLYLFDGVALTLVALGIFAVPEIINLMVKGKTISDTGAAMTGQFTQGVRDTLRHWFLVVRTSLLGVGAGMLPGLGGSVVDWFAYGHARSTEKGASETFGKGDVRGVIGVDAATNAKDGGVLVPTLLFGIPGSTPMALILGIFVLHGLQPGPQMVNENLHVTYYILLSLVVAQVLVYVICASMMQRIAKVTLVPFNIVGPVIIVIITFAAFQSKASMTDLVALAGLSLLGWLMKLYGWPRPPLVLGLVLSPLLERYLFISVGRYGAGWLTRPLVIVVGVLVVLSLVYGARQLISDHRGARERGAGDGA